MALTVEAKNRQGKWCFRIRHIRIANIKGNPASKKSMKFRHLDLNLLRVLVALHRTGSVTAAGHLISTPQSRSV